MEAPAPQPPPPSAGPASSAPPPPADAPPKPSDSNPKPSVAPPEPAKPVSTTPSTISLGRAYRLIWEVSRGFRVRILLSTLVSISVATCAVLGPTLLAQFFKVFEQGRTTMAPMPPAPGAPATVPPGPPAPPAPAGETAGGASLTKTELWSPIRVQLGPALSFNMRAPYVLVLAAIATLGMALGTLASAYFEENNRQTLVQQVKRRIYSRIQAAHVINPQRPAGELMNLISSQSQNLVTLIPTLIINPLSMSYQLLFAVIVMATANFPLTMIYIGMLLLIGIVLPRALGLDQRVVRASGGMRDAAMGEANVLNEQLAARDMVDALRVQDAAESRAATNFATMAKNQLKLVFAVQLRGLTSPLAEIIFPLIVLLGAAWGLPASKIIQLLTLYLPVLVAVRGLVALWGNWQQSGPALSLVEAEFNREIPPLDNAPLCPTAPAITLKDVHATLPDGKPILKGINLAIPAGKLTAVVGRGGTGKSLLLDVIAGRFRGALSGQISFNDRVLPADGMIRYRNQIPRLNQTPQLLRMPVKDFISFGITQPTRTVEEALELVGLGNSAPAERKLNPTDVIFVDRRPSGLQQQALRLAQLLVRPRPFTVLFDEPDSAMSAEDASKIQRLIRDAMTPESTVIMVTHAPQLLPPETLVIFLKDGKVEAVGPHSFLAATSEAYRALVQDLEHDAAKPAQVAGTGPKLRQPGSAAAAAGMASGARPTTGSAPAGSAGAPAPAAAPE